MIFGILIPRTTKYNVIFFLQCPFGFLADPRNKKLVCPDCRAMSCAKCLVPWEPQHEGISCQDFARSVGVEWIYVNLLDIWYLLCPVRNVWCPGSHSTKEFLAKILKVSLL